MKKIYSIILAAAAAFALLSCSDEWEPVFTLKYDDPGTLPTVQMTPNITIQDLKALYKSEGNPVHIENDYIIGGQVISDDRAGNIYRSLYIQDATGAIELKIGKSAMYNDYKLGQWVYVICKGLSLGNYNGMLQLGLEDASGEYETAYMLADYFISSHIFRGAQESPVEPLEVTQDQVLESVREGFSSELLGRYVTLRDLRFADRIFAIVYYDDPNDASGSGRVYLRNKDAFGVTTWAMSKIGFLDYLNAGNFDSATSSSDNRRVSDPELKDMLISSASPVTTSQYFYMEQAEIQVRTSGYSRFADTQIDPEVLSGEKTINVTGILTNYQGQAQFTLLDITGVEVN